MFRRRPQELPENVVSFLRDYNNMYMLDSNKEAKEKFEQIAKEIISGQIEEYISPAKRTADCLSKRGMLIQLFCKGHTLGVFSYYWEDVQIFGKFKRKKFISMHVNSNELMNMRVAKIVLVEGEEVELAKKAEMFQEFYYMF